MNKINKFQSWRRRIAAVVLAFCGVFVLMGSMNFAQAADDLASYNTCIADKAKPGAIQDCAGAFPNGAAEAKKPATGSTNSLTNAADTAAKITGTSQASLDAATQNLITKYNMPPDVAKFLINLIVVITIILKMLYALLVPIAGLIGKFMSNDWVTGTVFRLDVLIETIWQFIRNIVNVVIVLYLIYVAARNIVPFGENGQYDIKQVLPKVALALVVVNFSLFFCRTVLSIANVTTTMAFSMPNQIGSQVFAGFNARPYTDGGTLHGTTESKGEDPTSNDFIAKWYKLDANGKQEEVKTGIYNPFVWAEPLGSTDKKNLAATCPTDPAVTKGVTLSLSYVTETTGTGTSTNVSKCVDAAHPDDSTKWSDPIKGADDATTVYAMECLHKNYAFNLSDSLFSASGPTLIANPGLDVSSGHYVMIPEYYKRITIEDIGSAQGGSNFNQVYANKQALAILQKYSPTKAEWKYPYYSDCIEDLDELAFSARNAMYVYAFNLLHIPTYEKSFTDISSYSDVTVRLMMAFFFLFMFFGVTIALLIAMVARTFYIWVMMAMSPIWVLSDILKIWKGDDMDDEGIIGGFSKFLSVAFLPTLLGIILSVGFMMYHFLSLAGGLSGEDRGRFSIGSISLWFDAGDAVGGVGNLFSTMFGIFAIAVMWVAVFAAFKFGFKGMKTVNTILSGFNTGASNLAKFAVQSPLEHGILPITKGGPKLSISALAQLPQTAFEQMKSQRSQHQRMMLEGAIPGYGTMPDFARTSFQDRMKNRQLTAPEINSAMDEYRDDNYMKRTRYDIMSHIIDEHGNMKSDADLRSGYTASTGVEVSGANLIAMKNSYDPQVARTVGPMMRDQSIQSLVNQGLMKDAVYGRLERELDRLGQRATFAHGQYANSSFQYSANGTSNWQTFTPQFVHNVRDHQTWVSQIGATGTPANQRTQAYNNLRDDISAAMQGASRAGITRDAYEQMITDYMNSLHAPAGIMQMTGMSPTIHDVILRNYPNNP